MNSIARCWTIHRRDDIVGTMAGNGAGGISAMNTPQIDPLLPMPEVVSATGISRSSIYAGIKAGTFPRPVKVGAHASRWPSSRIAAWKSEA